MTALYKTANYLEPMLLLEYEINANCNTVYNAWTDINLFQKWFYPTGFSVARAEMVPNVGGYFRIHMKSPEGEIYPTKGEYLLLDKPNRIVYKDSWDDDREQNEPTVVELIFEPQSEKTVLKLYSSFATEQQKDTVLHSGIVDGWKMFFDNLNNLLKE
ncbi:SRPBCC domain-containing protein [Flavobacterium sp. WC2430]|uniref:SRPBCC family protein n=1 Tax=Flavobacterium sp. WC2430 TaxID=3234137 RepID=UPI003467CC20